MVLIMDNKRKESPKPLPNISLLTHKAAFLFFCISV